MKVGKQTFDFNDTSLAPWDMRGAQCWKTHLKFYVQHVPKVSCIESSIIIIIRRHATQSK